MGSESTELHRKLAKREGPVAVGVVSVTDSRSPETDNNGQWLRGCIVEAGHRCAAYKLVRDEQDEVADALDDMVAAGAQVVLFNGGTGIAPRDTTYDVLSRRLERPIPGFGELFRMLSWEQVGSAAMLSRAAAGLYRGVVVFALPGSPAAVRLAWEKLILPELQHVAWLAE